MILSIKNSDNVWSILTMKNKKNYYLSLWLFSKRAKNVNPTGLRFCINSISLDFKKQVIPE